MIDRTCRHCGGLFQVYPSELKKRKAEFCSKECRGLYRRKDYTKVCINCGKPFETGDKRAKLCSKDCQHKYKVGANSNNWKGEHTGIIYGY